MNNKDDSDSDSNNDKDIMSVRTIIVMIIMLNTKLTTPREGHFRDNETKAKPLNADSIKKPQASLTSFRVAHCVVENVCFLFEICEWGRGGVVVSTLDFRSEGRWFDAQSLPSCCFLRQDTLPHIVSLLPGV